MSRDESLLDATEEAADSRSMLGRATEERYRGHSERPDPSEPWRYACVSCGKPHIEVRRSGRRFKCIKCGERSDIVYDRREERKTRP